MTPNVQERIKRVRRACLGLLTTLPLVCGLASVAAAQPSDPARCEALRLKKESAYYQCIGRCDQRAARGRIEQSICEGRCERTFDAAQDRVEQSAPCQPEVVDVPAEPPPDPGSGERPPRHTPDPNPAQCEAQALQVEVRHLICLSRCESAATRQPQADTNACIEHCDTRAAASMDRTMTRPVCGLGRMPDGQAREQ